MVKLHHLFCRLRCLIFVYADEVSALVVDIGSSSLRAGYAGDDTPKAIIPTSYGYHITPQEEDFSMSGVVEEGGGASMPAQQKQPQAKLYIGQHGPSIWRSGMEVGNPLVDGLSSSQLSIIRSLVTHILDPSSH